LNEFEVSRQVFQKYKKLFPLDYLADILIKYRNESFRDFKMDPFHFVSAPSFSFHAALSKFEHPIDYIKDAEMYRIVKKSIRGGMVFVNKRLEYANIPGRKNFDPSKLEKELLFVDVNSLYSHALKNPLSYGGYRFLTNDEIREFDVTKVADDSNVGYMITGDMMIPEALHDFFDQMPLAAEKIIITPDMVSPYQESVYEQVKSEISNPVMTRPTTNPPSLKLGFVANRNPTDRSSPINRKKKGDDGNAK